MIKYEMNFLRQNTIDLDNDDNYSQSSKEIDSETYNK